MAIIGPENAPRHGFRTGQGGTHSSRTMMLNELRNLLDVAERNPDLATFRNLIVFDNVLAKATIATREKSLRHLRELYGLSPTILLFRAMMDLWKQDVDAQPLLAVLCAVARDPLLRGTVPAILGGDRGSLVTPQGLVARMDPAFREHYNHQVLAKVGRNAASTWTQSGHLQGRARKTRVQAESRPTTVAYALLLGHLCDIRGDALFSTLWCQLLDAPDHVLREQAQAASRQGWIEYRSGGGVTEVGFRHLLRDIDT
ncbi:MAG: hypothetical protein H0W23_03460 [Chloroflexia bacterium]|nr:hypothetical protein [Chloroflexia bacterium]